MPDLPVGVGLLYDVVVVVGTATVDDCPDTKQTNKSEIAQSDFNLSGWQPLALR